MQVTLTPDQTKNHTRFNVRVVFFVADLPASSTDRFQIIRNFTEAVLDIFSQCPLPKISKSMPL
jgi:hypothetical protein